MKRITRRNLIGQSSRVAAAAVVGLPLLSETFGSADSASALGGGSSRAADTSRKLKVVVAGGHPDDPETGCGGTAALYSDSGHEVVLLYLTRGEAGIRGKSSQQAAAIRTAEAQKACSILKTRPAFAGQIDGDTEINRNRYADFRKILQAERPDIVFTHWPIDTHRDHRVISLLVYDAWIESGKKFDLYYFEVDQGFQTQQFHPTHYVNITQTESRKRSACFAHASQDPADFYKLHDQMAQFRGLECGCKLAEAFVRHGQSSDSLPLPSRS